MVNSQDISNKLLLFDSFLNTKSNHIIQCVQIMKKITVTITQKLIACLYFISLFKQASWLFLNQYFIKLNHKNIKWF